MKLRRLLTITVFLAFGTAPLAPLMAADDGLTGTQGKFLNIQKVTSPGGITAWLVEDRSLPIVSLKFAFRNAGAKQDPADKQGLSILASNTMDEGAGPYDSESFQKILTDESIGLSFGSSRDDFTGGLKTLSRNKGDAFRFMQLALTKPRFDKEPLERMRTANIARIQRSRAQPQWQAARLMNDIAYQGHPYAQNSGGTLTTLKNITQEDLKSFARTRLAKDNLVVAATGDITPEELSRRLDELFGDLPAKAVLKDIQRTSLQNQGSVTLYKSDIPQTVMEMAQPGINRDDPDYDAAQIMNYIFGGAGFGSRLMEEVREKRGLTYGIYTSLVRMDDANALSISTSTANKNTAEILNIIKEQETLMASSPVSDEELADAKSYLIGSMPLALSSTGAISSMLLGLQLDNLPIDYLDHRADKLKAVTKEDIQRVAKRLLKPDTMITVLVGQPEGVPNAKTIESLPNVE